MRRVVFAFFFLMLLVLGYLTYLVYAQWMATGGFCR